jgi:uncharacterized protein
LTNASSSSRAIDVFELARTGGAVDGRLTFDDAPRLRASLREGAGAIDFRFVGSIDRQGRPAARLMLRGELPLTCDRCTQALQLQLAHATDFFFVREERELAELPVTVEDDAEPVLGSTYFDVGALVEDETILCLPLSPRHAECPAPAGGVEPPRRADRRNPFAVLPDLLSGKRR